MPVAPVLAFDLGGSKLAAALVEGSRILERREVPTQRAAGPASWIGAALELVADWRSSAYAGVAVTGVVRDGLWRALNPATLPIPDDYPLAATLERRLGLPVMVRNDAQAAAWGEYRFGGHACASMVFLTVSTGIGGGLIVDRRLLEGRAGLAGHIGITPVDTPAGVGKLEDLASGSALSRHPGAHGDPRAVTAAAARGESWAVAVLDAVASPLALALRRLQLAFDPDRIVIGGGLGLAPGYLDRLRFHLKSEPALLRPTLTAATLGVDAGLIGIADLAVAEYRRGTE